MTNKPNINLMVFVFLWQIIILASGLSLYGNSISWTSLFLFILFPLMVFGGSLAGLGISNKLKKYSPNKLFLDTSLTFLLLRLACLILIFLCLITIPKILEFNVLYRYIFFNEPEKIFGSFFVAFVITNFFIPFCYFLLIRLICFYEVSDLKKIIFVFVILISISVISLGRFALYEIIFFVTSIFLISPNRLTLLKLLIALVSLLIPLMITIMYFVFKTDLLSAFLSKEVILDIFYKYFLNYHFIGIYLFDWIVENKEQFFLIDQFGCNSIGWLMDILRKVFSFILGNVDTSCWRNSNLIINRGHYIEELGGTYNAFSTNLSVFFLDGGIAYVIFGGFLVGLFSQFFMRNHEFIIQPFFLLICFCMFFGVFTSMLNSFIVFTFIIYTLFFNFLGGFLNNAKLFKKNN